MKLQGLDILIRDQEAPRAGRMAAVAVSPGTKLQIHDCTVTVAGPYCQLRLDRRAADGGRARLARIPGLRMGSPRSR